MTQPPDETFAQPGSTAGEATREDDGMEGGKAAPGERSAPTGQLDGASGGYGTQSATGSSSGSGEGEPQVDDGAGSEATGATGEAPTDWLRRG